MIPRRVWINLAVFFGMFALLAWWAVNNVIKLDVIERPYTISAEFESAPGLRPNVEVTYLGVRVGTIRSLESTEGAIVVVMGIQKDRDLPEGITAAIRRKSAVGEPYVALEPPAGYKGDGRPIGHDAEHRIPLASTSVPLAYGDLFSAVDALVDSVPGPELNIVLDELATALDGRGPALRELLESGEDLSTTLAERTEMFDQLATNLTSLTHTIASERDSIGASFDNLAALTDTLATSRRDLDVLLEEAPSLGRRVDDLLQASLDDLGCAFGATGDLFDAIGDPARIAELLRVLDVAREARDAFESAVIEAGDKGADGPYLTGSIGITAGDAPPTYSPHPTLPSPPSLMACPQLTAAGPTPAGEAPTSHGQAGTDVDGHDLAVSPRPPAPEVALPASSDAPVGDQRFPLSLALFGVGLLIAGAAVVTSRVRDRGASTPVTDHDAPPPDA